MFAKARFPFTTTEICALGFEFAEEQGIPGVSAAEKVTGHKWFKVLMSRHTGLTLKLPKLLFVLLAKMCQ